MLSTKNTVSLADIPREWIYEYYLKLDQKLTGQDIKMNSIFNVRDKRPSFYVYYSIVSGYYLWKDFSANKHGDGVGLVQELMQYPNRYDAARRIVHDYANFIKSGNKYVGPSRFQHDKYRVAGIKRRKWNMEDRAYWTQYKIGSDILKFFNVQPLSYFRLINIKLNVGPVVKAPMLYGYFRKDGSLYKIYKPKMEVKFFNVSPYVQGADQLTGTRPNLIICSSLKDMMALKALGYKSIETIAPASESQLLPEKSIQKLKSRYKNVLTLFDNDPGGIEGMARYEKAYGLKGIHLRYEKDLAECVRIHGVNNTRELLTPLLLKEIQTKNPILNEIYIDR